MNLAGRFPASVVLAGPTADCKGSVAADVRRYHPEAWISVSATTRPPRPGEQDGVHYWFVDDDQFDAMVERGDLLEWAVVHKAARYGTPRQPVEAALAEGRPARPRSTSKVLARCGRPCPTRASSS